MTIQGCQDHGDFPHSASTLLAGSTGNSLDTDGQIITEEGYASTVKIRKPYTITKQRERWTVEEHKRFIEALKLYGRSWRKIEEHVGTKTAVQIRSHAQKFFSKVARESNNSNSVEYVEIPPPRPKRKPNYPYPRKLVLPAKKKTPPQEQSSKSTTSVHSSLDQENQSPTSVLSAVASDILGSEDSNTPLYGSPKDINHAATNMTSENDPSGQENTSELDEPVSTKLDMSPNEGSVEATSTKILRLFGKTLSVMDVESADAAVGNAVWYTNASSDPKPVQVARLHTAPQKYILHLWHKSRA